MKLLSIKWPDKQERQQKTEMVFLIYILEHGEIADKQLKHAKHENLLMSIE